MKKWIQIWYSWGDQESPVEVPDGVDAWKYMMELAANESRIEIIEHASEFDVILHLSSDMKKVTLYYTDGERCYYLITDEEDWEPEEDEDWEDDE